MPARIRHWGRTLGIVFLVLGTWGALALLSLQQGPAASLAFTGDYAAIAQFLFAVPLLLAGEPYLDIRTSETADHLVNGGVLTHDEATQPDGKLARAWSSVARLNRSVFAHVAVAILAYVITWMWLRDEMADGLTNWRMQIGTLTPAGWWMGLVALPVFHFVWLRWAMKMMLWAWFLQRLAASNPSVSAFHPDGAGGVAFLGTIQASFGILIFAFGAVTTATALYNIHVMGIAPEGFLGVGLVLLYLVCAPALFVAPLLYFTRPLRQAKLAALHACARATLNLSSVSDNDLPERSENITALNDLYRRIAETRTLPFDFATLRSLLISALTPVAPLLIQLIPWAEVRVVFGRIFGAE